MYAKHFRGLLLLLILATVIVAYGNSSTNVQATGAGYPSGFRLPFNTTSLVGGKVNVTQGPRCGSSLPQSHYYNSTGLGYLNNEAIDFALPWGHPVVAPQSEYRIIIGW